MAAHLLAAAVAAMVVVALPVTILGTAVAGTAIRGDGCAGDGGPGGGSQAIGGASISAEQADNARTIVTVTHDRGLPERAAVIALATALVESDLRNVNGGDRDSLGLFQERPSQGWGIPEQILNPAYATDAFLTHLVAIPNWAGLPPGAAEQDVERSANPSRYAPQEPTATHLTETYWPATDATAELTSVPTCPDQGGAGPVSRDSVALPTNYALPTDPRQAAAVSFALAQLGKPYRWGAKGPDAFDCSGLVQAAWAAAGVALHAGTTSQVHDGTPVASLDAAQPGDLLFIPGSLGTPAVPRHVGLYLGDNLVINAYDSKTGVIIQALAGWARQIVAIRRPTTPAGGLA